MLTSELSSKFKNMAFIAACLVVLIHSGKAEEQDGSSWWFVQLVTEGVFRMAVPFFFLTSGFFLAQYIDGCGWWRREVKKRVRSRGLDYKCRMPEPFV